MMKKVLFLFLLLLCSITITAQTVEGNVSVKVNETSSITPSTTYSGSGDISNNNVIEPMIKSLWHQNAPYNNMIPKGKSASCGPIAVAQILNYYKAPNHGFGHVTLYGNDLDYSSTSIDYSNILNEYTGGDYTQAQADAVANLVWHVGAAMTLKYSTTDGTPGTDNNRMVWGIQKYLHVSQNCRFRLRKFYSTEQWMKMLDEQLAAGRPVYYRGRAFRYNDLYFLDNSGSGHIFVVDGKNSEGLYHINFGHGSTQQNKFVSLDAINQSSSIYPGDYGVYYNWEQGMATDLYPDEYFDETIFNDYPVYLEEPLCLNNNKRLDRLTIATGGSFQLTMNLKVYNDDYIKAKDGTKGYWQYALGVYSGEILKTVITPQEGNTFSSTSGVTLTNSFVFPTAIDNGEYELRVVTRYRNEELWQSVWDIAPNVINAVVDNNNVVLTTMGNHTLETYLYLLSPITEIGNASGIYPGKLFAVKLKNPSDNNFEDKIKFEVITNGTVRATYWQNTSVYSGCEVEYHFLIPNEEFDFANNSDYTVKAYYYEHNHNNYIELTTDEPNKQGDVNGDGEVNGTDIVALVNVIMEKAVNDNADVNKDGAVNGTDMVTLVNIVMAANNNAREYIAARRSIENQDQSPVSVDTEINQGMDNKKELTIMLHNPEMDITMVQMDVTLPDGLSLREDGTDMLGRTTWSSHQLYTGNVGNHTTRLLLVSGRNALIQGAEGGIILLSLVANDEFVGGDVILHNMLCTSPDLTEVRPADYMLHVSNNATGFSEMEKTRNSEDKQWYNLSGQRMSVPRKGVYIVGGKKVVK